MILFGSFQILKMMNQSVLIAIPCCGHPDAAAISCNLPIPFLQAKLESLLGAGEVFFYCQEMLVFGEGDGNFMYFHPGFTVLVLPFYIVLPLLPMVSPLTPGPEHRRPSSPGPLRCRNRNPGLKQRV